MRLHRLEMAAFGPFADRVTVDFDELHDAGVFLLTGATGAGKTSVLDAVCFALYGSVPGARGVRTLRSHHAADDVTPEVTLELTLGGRRYRVRRTPEWHRPKKRGEGTTKVQASAQLVDLSDGEERLVSARVQEVGHELGLLLGMSVDQFQQVVLLPQGEFQRFLRATSDERQSVLERLFQTQRFARIEDWVRERARDLGERARRAEQDVIAVVQRIAERADTPVPDHEARPDDQFGAWSREVLDTAQLQARADAAASREAEQQVLKAESVLYAAQEWESVTRRRREATEQLAELDASSDRADEAAARLEADERTAPVLPLIAVAEDAAALVDRARSQLRHAVRGLTEQELVTPETAALARDVDILTGHGGVGSSDDDGDDLARACAPVQDALRGEESVARAREADLHSLLPRCRALSSAATACRRAERESARTRAELTGARSDWESLDADEQSLALEGDHLAEREAEAAALGLLLDEARRRATAAVERTHLAAEAVALDAAAAQQRDLALTARAEHLDLVERRLAGIAAELAGALEPDQECPVCGSTAHPVPAVSDGGAVSELEQRQAQDRAAREQRRADEAAARAAQVRQQVALLEQAADGLSAAEAQDHLAGLEQRLAALGDPGTARRQWERRVRDVADRRDAVRRRLDLAEAADVDARVALVSATESWTRLHREVLDEATRVGVAGLVPLPAGLDATGLDPSGEIPVVPDWLPLIESSARAAAAAAAAVRRALDALDAYVRAQEAAEVAVRRARTALVDAGFCDAAEVRDAVLRPELREDLRRDLRARAARAAAAHAVLSEPDPASVAPAIDAGAAAARVTEARAAHSAATSATAVSTARATALARLHADLLVALEAWTPVAQESLTATEMAQLVRGMGGQNHLQMRLSSYVLATRLDQVLDAANARLVPLRDQRYTLHRTASADRRNARSGLGLEVHDAWTGESRSPSTLSGGETFVVSLALALGLADVVAQEAGGLRVDTLFIDEGFGMLDPDTLDDVMDRLDALRAGGRSVGVVSHVTELRSRIPTQVHVVKGRAGSRIDVATAVS